MRTDQYVAFHNVSWAGYEQLLQARGESAKPRMTYLRGELEIMSPSGNHEHAKKMIARLLQAYATEMDMEFNGYGSTTYKDKIKKMGLEPDECYHFGPAKAYPDLALEIVWSNVVGIDRMAIYAAFCVREVWIWQDGAITLYKLAAGLYKRSKKSGLLPQLDLALLTRFVDRQDQTRAVREFVAALKKRADRTDRTDR